MSITYKDLSSIINRINRYKKKNGIHLDRAYGMNCIYLIDKEEYKKKFIVIKNLFNGTKSECYTYLSGIEKGITLE